jgi:hypothetical protein
MGGSFEDRNRLFAVTYQPDIASAGASVLTGLVKHRAELTADIERTHECLRRMLADLESRDATILQFDPRYSRSKQFAPKRSHRRQTGPTVAR